MAKKVFIINHYAGAPKYGMEYRHFEIAKELVKNNINVCIIAATFTHLRDSPTCKKEKIEGIDFLWVKAPKYNGFGLSRFINMLMFSINLFFYKKHFPFKPNLIIVSSPSPFPIINALWLKFKYKAKLVYEIRDVWPLSIIELKGISKNNILIRLLSKLDVLGIKYCDAIMSPLHNIALYVQEKGFKRDIMILPNGISEISQKETLKNTHKEKTFIIGYGGSLGNSNSIMNLINAAITLKSYSSIKFKIIGSGEKEKEIVDIIKSENLQNVDLIGRTSKENLFKQLSECDILYKGNPNKNIYKYGISSIKLVEYLLLKKPIIDASIGVDIVAKSNSGVIVEHEDHEQLAKGILKMKNMSKDELKIMSINGYDFVRNNYLYEKIVHNMLINLYKKNLL
jgi:hypothetical protein